MSFIPIEQLVQYTTSDALFEKLLDTLEAVKLPARSWRAGAVSRTILGGLAEVGSQGSAIVTSCVRGGFLLFAAGPYLKAHAKDVYDVDFIPATFASGKVTLTNDSGAIRTVGADELVVRASGTKKRFRVTEAFVIGPGETLSVDAQAIEPGSASSVGPGEIDELETKVAKLSVTNAASLVGRDEESEPSIVKRCLLKKGTWSPFGPRDAYEYAALSATLAGDAPTSITRANVSRYSSKGQVRTVCATPSGAPTSIEIDAVKEAVEKMARPSSVTSIVEAAVPKPTAHTITLWARGGTESIVRERATTAMNALIASWPIGGVSKSDGGQGYLFADAIAAALIGSSSEAFDVDGVGGDIALAFNEVVTNTTEIDVRVR